MTALHDSTTPTTLTEIGLLGALMVWPEELHTPDGQPRVRPDDFTNAHHGTILQIVQAAWEKHGIRDDLPSLAAQFPPDVL